jgi:hypothetical protein
MKTIATVAVVIAVAAAGFGVFYWVIASEHVCDPANLLRIEDTGKVYSLEVVDSADSTIWKITSSEGADPSRIDYGILPPAFRQEVPAGPAQPGDLVTGEALRTRTVTEKYVLVHDGKAVSARSMSWGLSTFTPLSPSPDRR